MSKNFDRFRCPVPAKEVPHDERAAASAASRLLSPGRLVAIWAGVLAVSWVVAPPAAVAQMPVLALTVICCLIAGNLRPVLPGLAASCSALLLVGMAMSVRSVHVGAAGAVFVLLLGLPVVVFLIGLVVYPPFRKSGNPAAENTSRHGVGPDSRDEASPSSAALAGNGPSPLPAKSSRPERSRLLWALGLWAGATVAGFLVSPAVCFSQLTVTVLALLWCFLSGNSRPVMPGLITMVATVFWGLYWLRIAGPYDDAGMFYAAPPLVFFALFAACLGFRKRVHRFTDGTRHALGLAAAGIFCLLFFRIFA